MKSLLGKALKEILSAVNQLAGEASAIDEKYLDASSYQCQDAISAYTNLAWIYENAMWRKEEEMRKDMEKTMTTNASEEIPAGLNLPTASYVSTHFVDKAGNVTFELSKASASEDEALLKRYVGLGLSFSQESSQIKVNQLAKEFGENKGYVTSLAAEIPDQSKPRHANLLMLRLSEAADKLNDAGKQQLLGLGIAKRLELFDGSVVYASEIKRGAKVFCKTPMGFASVQDGEITLKDKCSISIRNGEMESIDMGQSNLLSL